MFDQQLDRHLRSLQPSSAAPASAFGQIPCDSAGV